GDMFNAMMEAFMEEDVGYLFNIEVQSQEQTAPEVGVSTANGSPVVITSGPDLDEDGVDVHVTGGDEEGSSAGATGTATRTAAKKSTPAKKSARRSASAKESSESATSTTAATSSATKSTSAGKKAAAEKETVPSALGGR